MNCLSAYLVSGFHEVFPGESGPVMNSKVFLVYLYGGCRLNHSRYIATMSNEYLE